MGIRHRKLWGVFLACTVAGWFGLVASPVVAHVPPDNNVNFNPDEFNGSGIPALGAGGQTKEAELPSDDEDGFGTVYELRAVADQSTSFYEWYDCTDGGNPSLVGAPCAPIATDTAGDPAPTPPGEGPALAFTGAYNIPQTSNFTHPGNERDVYGIACQADAVKGGPPFDASHCIPNDVTTGAFDGVCAIAGQSCVADVHMDNAQATGDHAATTSGRIVKLVTTNRNFDHPDVHGAGLKNGDSLTVVAFTSAGGADAIHFCLDQFSDDETGNDLPADVVGAGPFTLGGGCTHNAVDTSPTPGGATACDAAAPTAAGGDCWAATIGVPNANTVFGLSIIEIDDFGIAGATFAAADAEGATQGTGDCAGAQSDDTGDDCQLDKVYVTTTAAGEAGVVPPPPPPPPPPPDRRITTGLCDRNRPTANQNELLVGDNGPDQICGFGGRDTLRGRGGTDTLRGGGGKDILAGGNGRDNLRGGGGADSLRGGRGADTLRGGGGRDTGRGGPGKDLCRTEIKRGCDR